VRDVRVYEPRRNLSGLTMLASAEDRALMQKLIDSASGFRKFFELYVTSSEKMCDLVVARIVVKEVGTPFQATDLDAGHLWN